MTRRTIVRNKGWPRDAKWVCRYENMGLFYSVFKAAYPCPRCLRIIDKPSNRGKAKRGTSKRV